MEYNYHTGDLLGPAAATSGNRDLKQKSPRNGCFIDFAMQEKRPSFSKHSPLNTHENRYNYFNATQVMSASQNKHNGANLSIEMQK